MKKLFLVALAAVGMASCVQTEELAVVKSDAIAFEQFVNNATKVSDNSLTKDNLSAFQVWGYMENNTGHVFRGEVVEKSGSAWTYSPLQYWAPGKNYYFEAVAPANGSWVKNETTVSDLEGVTFTNNNGTEDLIYAYYEQPARNKEQLSTASAVALQFQHLLSKVQFSFKSAFPADNVTINVSNVTMSVPSQGKVVFENKTWDVLANGLTLNFGNGESTLVSGNNAAFVSAQKALFTIPTDANYTYEVKFNVQVLQGEVEQLNQEVTSTISGRALEVGHAYNFTALIGPEVFDLKPIEFEVEGVDTWNDPATDVEVDYTVSEDGASYSVSNATGLQQVAAGINAGEIANDVTISLNSDIDLAATRAASNWTPIGTSAEPFTGTFDGKGYTIKNLVIDGGSSSNIGFFGVTHNGEIKNLVIENAKVSGRLNVGVVAGTPYTSKYSNITVTGHVEVNGMAYVGAVGGKDAYASWDNIVVDVDETSYVNANSIENGRAYRTYVGGVIGFCGEGGHTFSNIHSNIDVKGSTIDVGGIVGIAHYGNNFVNCVCDGDVEIYSASEEAEVQEIGGIAGVWHNENGTKVTFTNCKFTGELKANNNYVIDTNKFGNLVCAAYGTGTGVLVIDGNEYTLVDGKVVINGCTPVSTADAFANALSEGGSVFLQENINITMLDLTTQTNDVVIDANGKTITTESNYGVQVKAGKNITLKNATVEMTVEGNYITYAAGLKIENGDYQGKTITLKDCVIRMANADWAYAVNMPASVKNLNLVIDGCTLEGAIALQCWGDNNTITVTNSNLICNYTTSSMYTSYCVALQGDGSNNSENNTLNISGCAFSYSGVDNFNSTIYSVYNSKKTTGNTITVVDCTYGEKVKAY